MVNLFLFQTDFHDFHGCLYSYFDYKFFAWHEFTNIIENTMLFINRNGVLARL